MATWKDKKVTLGAVAGVVALGISYGYISSPYQTIAAHDFDLVAIVATTQIIASDTIKRLWDRHDNLRIKYLEAKKAGDTELMVYYEKELRDIIKSLRGLGEAVTDIN